MDIDETNPDSVEETPDQKAASRTSPASRPSPSHQIWSMLRIQPRQEPPPWENPWEQIQATAHYDDPETLGLEGHIMTPELKRLASSDPDKFDVANANMILEAKVKDELQFQYYLLATILAVDGRQRRKTYRAILRARPERYKRRLDRWRWDKIFKPVNDVVGSRVETKQQEGEAAIDYHKRLLYASIVAWLSKYDEQYGSMEDGWAKCKYVTEHALHKMRLLTNELWEERAELERIYREHKGKPPAFYQSNWSGPLSQNE